MSGVCSTTNFKVYLPFLNLMVALWDELNKSGKVGKKDEDKIYKEVNEIFKVEKKTNEDLPFDFNSTLFSVKLLWKDSQSALSRMQWGIQNYTTQHEYIEISGKNGCIYTLGLFVDKNGKPEIVMNDYTFTICTLKNEACAEAILKDKIYEKVDEETGKVLHQIKNKKDCNVLCKNMVNMRDDDRNKYTPISHTRQKNLLGTMMEGVLNIDHIKILQYLIFNSNVINVYDIPSLKISLDQASYSASASIKFKSETMKKALSWVGLGKACSKEKEFNCRTFAEDFYTDSTKMLSTLKSILRKPDLHPGLINYVDTLLPFPATPTRKPTPSASQKRKSKSLTPAARKSKSLTASQKRKSKSLTPAARKSKSLTPRRSKSLGR
jgi:hypothetical protein